MRAFSCDGVRLCFCDSGEGRAFVFQHGLGGDHEQTFSVAPVGPGTRQLTLDCRGHGCSTLGDPAQVSFDRFAEDLLALLRMLGIGRLALGGISMGAAVALALERAGRAELIVEGLVLVRPAWGQNGMPEPALSAYKQIAELLRRADPHSAALAFTQSETFQEILRTAPAAAESLLSHFEGPRVADLTEIFERLPAQSPVDRGSLASIEVPTLILATDRDPIHPLALARELAECIGAAATLAEVPSKSTDAAGHAHGVRCLIRRFLSTTREAGS